MTVPADRRSPALNGISLSALEDTPEHLAQAPEQGILTFQTRTRWLGGVRSRSEVDGLEAGGQRVERTHVIESDEPAQFFGTDTAPSPQELLLAGIGACISATYAMQATLMGIELVSLEVELRGTLDLRRALDLAEDLRGYPEVGIRVHVDAHATPAQIQVLHQQCLKRSPNFYQLTTAVPARTQLVIKG
jgi:uncharacterized OsmC-like protein